MTPSADHRILFGGTIALEKTEHAGAAITIEWKNPSEEDEGLKT